MKPYLTQHFLEASCERLPDKICMEELNDKITYQQCLVRAQKISGLLYELGVRPGDRIGVYLNRSIDQVTAILGIWFSGAALVIINPILNDDQVKHIIQDADIETVITNEKNLIKKGALFIETGVQQVFNFGGEQQHLDFRAIINFTGDFSSVSQYRGDSNCLSTDLSHIIYTSGSTGKPKGIVISHGNTIEGGKIVSLYTKLRQDDRILATLPFNFDYGFNQLINTFYVGGTCYLHQFFMPNDLLKILEEKSISVFAGMTPIWAKIFNPQLCDLSKPIDLSGVRVITNTGGKVPVVTTRKLRGLFPKAKIYLMYGLTEAFRSTCLDPDQIENRPESIGKAVPGVQIMVLNKDGKQCEPHEEGELVHRGALISKGYWNNPEKTAEVFKPNPMFGEKNRHLETVVFSGDIVKRDEEGYVYYVGRKDHMIKTKGYRVSPTEVEEFIKNFDGVAGCVATGYEVEDGINLRIIIQVSDPTLTIKQILMHCKRDLPFYLVPDDIVVRKTFPLTPNGKIDRNQIIREAGNE